MTGYGLLDAYAAVKAALTHYVQNVSYYSTDEIDLCSKYIIAGNSVIPTCPYGDVTIFSGSHITISATERITLKPGFHACSGSDVHLCIRPCSDDDATNMSAAPQRRKEAKEMPIEEITNNSFTISPNPATNSITISGLSEDATYSIYNLTGEKVNETTETTIDISALPAGMYVVIATTDGKTYQSKFIKE